MKNVVILFSLVTIALVAEALYLILRDRLMKSEKAISESLEAIRGGAVTVKKPGGGILRVNVLSKNQTVHKILSALPFTEALDNWLEQAHVRMLLSRFLLFTVLSCVVVASSVFVLTKKLPFGFLGAIGGAVVPWFYVLYAKRRRMAKLSEQLPEALDTIVRSLRAGYSMSAAFEVVSNELPPPISTEFSKVKEENKLGMSLKDSMENLLKRCANMDVKLFVTSVLIQWEIGGNLTEILGNLSYTIRERFKLRGHIKALTAEGRLSGLVLGVLPLVVGVIIYYLNPEYMDVFFTTYIGKVMVVTAAFLVILGWAAIKKIVTIDI
jgi:tight adherence protein B